MRNRHRGAVLAGLGALVGLCSVGCETLQLNSRFTAPETRMAGPAVTLMRPRKITPSGESQVVASRPRPSLIQPVATSEPVNDGTVPVSSWRAMPAGKQSIGPVLPGEITTLHQPRPMPGADGMPGELKVDGSDAEKLPSPRTTGEPVHSVVVGHFPGAHVAGSHGGHNVPREGSKMPLPPYIIEPPDILLIQFGLTRKPEALPQLIDGQHLVRPDGTVNLGIYGSVQLAGLTLDQAREVIALKLREKVQPLKKKDEAGKDVDLPLSDELIVDVLAYNSKVYYIITSGGGYGEQVYRLPIVGSETVLDAFGHINGLPPVASKKKIWVARAGTHGQPQILPVDWNGIAQRGAVSTNYQMMPGDRLYVKADARIWVDSQLAKTLNPIERGLGATLLGSGVVNSISGRFNNRN